MPKKSRDYRAWQVEQLADPIAAANFLSAAISESPEMFLTALGHIVKAHEVTSVAKEAGVARESLYRSLSKHGNPTLDTLTSVLDVFGVRLAVVPNLPVQPAPPPHRDIHDSVDSRIAGSELAPLGLVAAGPQLVYVNPAIGSSRKRPTAELSGTQQSPLALGMVMNA